MKSTFMANAGNITRKWYIVDAEGLTLGRLAASVAKVLTGKNKPTYTGGDRYQKAGDALREKPAWVVEHAIRGMLPKNKLGAQMYRKLHVYAGAEHPHAAQKPEELKLNIR